MLRIEDIMEITTVIPVIVIDNFDDAVPMATALVAGGLRVLEVTMRTPVALDAIRAMKAVDGAIVGAGTVLNPDDLDAAIEAGAQFIVSPGLTEPLGLAAVESGIAFLPGVATAADIMRGFDLGLSHFKFFPASTSGGIPSLKALTGPFGRARFCPTGGITQESAADWLALEAVRCVGGSWMLPKGPLDAAALTTAAAKAATLRAP